MPSLSLISRLSSLATRLGLGARDQTPRRIEERAEGLRLAFPPLPELQPSIFWDDNPPLHYLHELPRSALSGPIQEHKARAHTILIRVIERVEERLPAFDLRQVDGIISANPLGEPCPNFETFATSSHCRGVRIISYKDFERTINEAIPGFKGSPTVNLLQATWQGERVFWAGEQHVEDFVCAIAYARLRGLELPMPCNLVKYRVAPSGLQEMEQAYHALLVPDTAWVDRDFMRPLLDDGIPYARLRLQRRAIEVLLLDRRHPLADALGTGLKKAGANDLADYLRKLFF